HPRRLVERTMLDLDGLESAVVCRRHATGFDELGQHDRAVVRGRRGQRSRRWRRATAAAPRHESQKEDRPHDFGQMAASAFTARPSAMPRDWNIEPAAMPLRTAACAWARVSGTPGTGGGGSWAGGGTGTLPPNALKSATR